MGLMNRAIPVVTGVDVVGMGRVLPAHVVAACFRLNGRVHSMRNVGILWVGLWKIVVVDVVCRLLRVTVVIWCLGVGACGYRVFT
jgi:hypothetical protein